MFFSINNGISFVYSEANGELAIKVIWYLLNVVSSLKKINDFINAPKDCCKPMPKYKEEFLDVINKDDLVQNFPDEGVFALSTAASGASGEWKKVEMFEGEEDMYFRTDGTNEECDEFAGVPTVSFMETVENICSLKLKR